MSSCHMHGGMPMHGNLATPHTFLFMPLPGTVARGIKFKAVVLWLTPFNGLHSQT